MLATMSITLIKVDRMLSNLLWKGFTRLTRSGKTQQIINRRESSTGKEVARGKDKKCVRFRGRHCAPLVSRKLRRLLW